MAAREHGLLLALNPVKTADTGVTMSMRLVTGIVAAATLALVSLSAQAEPVPPACVVVDAPPVHVQVGYAPNGPGDCTALP